MTRSWVLIAPLLVAGCQPDELPHQRQLRDDLPSVSYPASRSFEVDPRRHICAIVDRPVDVRRAVGEDTFAGIVSSSEGVDVEYLVDPWPARSEITSVRDRIVSTSEREIFLDRWSSGERSYSFGFGDKFGTPRFLFKFRDEPSKRLAAALVSSLHTCSED